MYGLEEFDYGQYGLTDPAGGAAFDYQPDYNWQSPGFDTTYDFTSPLDAYSMGSPIGMDFTQTAPANFGIGDGGPMAGLGGSMSMMNQFDPGSFQQGPMAPSFGTPAGMPDLGPVASIGSNQSVNPVSQQGPAPQSGPGGQPTGQQSGGFGDVARQILAAAAKGGVGVGLGMLGRGASSGSSGGGSSAPGGAIPSGVTSGLTPALPPPPAPTLAAQQAAAPIPPPPGTKASPIIAGRQQTGTPDPTGLAIDEQAQRQARRGGFGIA